MRSEAPESEAPEAEPGRRRRQHVGGGEGEEAAETQATTGATAGSISWLDDDGGQRAAAAGASGESWGQTEGETGARGTWRGPTSRFDRSVQDPQIVGDSSRPSDKSSITIFVRAIAHEYTLNAVFTP